MPQLDFQTFGGAVYKILTRSYLGEDAINSSKECIDYFGSFSPSNILVNLSLEPSSGLSEEKAPKKAKLSNFTEDFDDNLIICESEARMRAVASAAVALGENDYVPFKMLL
jgi:hypothetical protein